MRAGIRLHHVARYTVSEDFAQRNKYQARNVQRLFAGALDDFDDFTGRYFARRQVADAPVDVIAQLLPSSLHGQRSEAFTCPAGRCGTAVNTLKVRT